MPTEAVFARQDRSVVSRKYLSNHRLGRDANQCHCEERRDEAISSPYSATTRDCFASLAMTKPASLAR